MESLEKNRTAALQVLRKLCEAGYETYFAGGCVRDTLLNLSPKDFDIATAALPNEIESLFSKTLDIGKKFGTIIVNDYTSPIEVTTFRSDNNYQDGRHPESVRYSNAKEDAIRRDFTINGLFFDPIKDELIDFLDGKKDIENKIIKAIGNPDERFKEDHLRMLRAVRFAHSLNFKIEHKTVEAIKEHAHLIEAISIERIENELSRILVESNQPGDALQSLFELGLLKYILPEVVKLKGVQQPPDHHPEGDVFTHVKLMLNLTSSSIIPCSFSKKELCYAILFHDISKPEKYMEEIQEDGTTRIRFLGHERKGAEVTKNILKRLKLSNKETSKITTVIAEHMKPFQVKEMKLSTLRKIMGTDYFELLLELHRLDGLGSKGLLPSYTYLKNKHKEYEAKDILPKPLISGNDLLVLNIRNGPKLGKILDEVYNKQLEDNLSKTDLLIWIKEKIGAESGT